jgi:hypothetical protein
MCRFHFFAVRFSSGYFLRILHWYWIVCVDTKIENSLLHCNKNLYLEPEQISKGICSLYIDMLVSCTTSF